MSGSQNKTESIAIDRVVMDSPKAWLVRIVEGPKVSEHWFPRSLCELSADEKYIEVPTWLLNEKGIV